MQRHCANADALAKRLDQHPAVKHARHPSLAHSPDHRLAKRDYPHGTGAVWSFELDTDIAGVQRVFDALQLIKLAANLGDRRSMAVHPASPPRRRRTPDLPRAGEIRDQTSG